MPNDKNSEMESAFLDRAQGLLDEIMEKFNPGIIDFKLDAFSIQDMLNYNKLSPNIMFPADMFDQINERNEVILRAEKITSR